MKVTDVRNYILSNTVDVEQQQVHLILHLPTLKQFSVF